MASTIRKNTLEENFTEFPQADHPTGGSQYQGAFAVLFKKLFSKPKRGRPTKIANTLQGDAPTTTDSYEGVGAFSTSKTAVAPQVEYERRRKYSKFEKMDDYPEIGTALDIYADDATLLDEDCEFSKIKTEHRILKDEYKEFIKNTKLNRYIWDITRNVVKYGECFTENIVDLNNTDAGIQRVKILNPNYIYRVEDKYGYLVKFMQEVPVKDYQLGYSAVGASSPDKRRRVDLDKEQVVHFRRRTSDQNFYPYGKSVMAPAIKAWESLRLMEDAMVIYRLQRAPERRVFYIETGNIPQTKVEVFIERLKQKFKKEKFWNPQSGGIDERYNPLAADEDFFVPHRNGKGTKIEVLKGAENLGEVDDVKYFRDKLLAAMKVPKDYIVEKDKSPERKANLGQLDIKFAKTIMRVQQDIVIGLEEMFRRHLRIRGIEEAIVSEFSITMTPPSDMLEKRKLEMDEQKVRVIQGVQQLQLFSKDTIYRKYFGMTDAEIEAEKALLEQEMELMQAQGAEAAVNGGGAEAGMEPNAPEPPPA